MYSTVQYNLGNTTIRYPRCTTGIHAPCGMRSQPSGTIFGCWCCPAQCTQTPQAALPCTVSSRFHAQLYCMYWQCSTVSCVPRQDSIATSYPQCTTGIHAAAGTRTQPSGTIFGCWCCPGQCTQTPPAAPPCAVSCQLTHHQPPQPFPPLLWFCRYRPNGIVVVCQRPGDWLPTIPLSNCASESAKGARSQGSRCTCMRTVPLSALVHSQYPHPAGYPELAPALPVLLPPPSLETQGHSLSSTRCKPQERQ